MKTVLHITEAFGGGIQTALHSYAYSTSKDEIKHKLLVRHRPDDDTGMVSDNLFDDIIFIHGNLLQFYFSLCREVKRIQPDIIHLHSSFAGFLGRFIPKGKAKLVYTPHCYSFERTDISSMMQKLYQQLEKIKIDRIDVIAGCSKRECLLAEELGAKKVVYLNNYVVKTNNETNINIKNITDDSNNLNSPMLLNIVVIGRISAQKDPYFLIKTIKELKQHSEYQQIQISWLGGGNIQLEQALIEVGVDVSGMIPYSQLINTLKKANLYLHTAAWEGMPLTILEAASFNIPMILRTIGATQSLNYPFTANSPEQMAELILNFIHKPNDPAYLEALQIFKDGDFSSEKQRDSLLDLYEV